MKKVTFLLAAILILGVSNLAQAQVDTDEASHTVTVEIPEIAIVDIEGSSTALSLEPEFSGEAGDGLDFTAASAQSQTLWLNYTSIVTASGTDVERTISVEVTSGTIPSGVDINLTAANPSGTGTVGSTTGAVVLSDQSAQTVIDGIGSCYTGDGTSVGSNLQYSLTESVTGDFSDMVEQSSSLTVTYTISDN